MGSGVRCFGAVWVGIFGESWLGGTGGEMMEGDREV